MRGFARSRIRATVRNMNLWIVIGAMAVAAATAAWLAGAAASRRAQAQMDALRQDMQTLVAAQSQAVGAQFIQLSQTVGQLSQTVVAQTGQVLQQVQSGMASTGTLATNAQKSVSEQLQASTEMLGSIRQQLGEVQQSGNQLFEAARQIESVLGSAKTRGMLGEVALERMLTDCLPPGAYEMQFRFASGEAVDAVVHLGKKKLPIDSKFPLEDYRRLEESGGDGRNLFFQAVRKHADSIAKKYILPGEDTLDMALMFVPSEGVYYELLHTEDGKGLALDEYCRRRGIVAVSPSTLFAHLQVILMGLQGMRVEENARKLLSNLSGLKKQFDNFGEVYDKLGVHLRNAQQSYSDSGKKLERATNTLDEMAQGTLAEKALDAVAPDAPERLVIGK
jgi:DNA recombination protein RmuC